MDPRDKLRLQLDAAYQDIMNRAPTDPVLLSYALLDLCRSADFHYMYLSPSDVAKHGFYFQAGWQRALQLFLPRCKTPRGLVVPLLVCGESRAKFADSLLYSLGELEAAKNVLEHCYDGLARLQEQDGVFRVEYSVKHRGIEKIEHADYRWVIEHMPSWFELRMTQRKKWSSILKQMRKRVYIFKDHFLGYRCTPDIDEYFSRESLLYSQRLIGYDAFPDDATFGGIPFRLFREATRHVVEWTLKHEQFAEQLYRGNKRKLDRRNLVTLWWREEDLVRDLGLLLELSQIEARAVVDALVLRSGDNKFLEGHGLPQPPYISLGNGWLLRSMAGALGNPFSFVLRRLEALHGTDYSREHKRREAMFRDQLYQLFPDNELIKIERSVDLTEGSKLLTDLDGVILDHRTGTVGLFQLKWQDAFGGSMPERRSKQKNLQIACEDWIRTVQMWLDDHGYGELFNRLHLRKKQKFAVKRVLLFVLGRTFSQFSGDGEPGPDAAWGNWYQVKRLTQSRQMDVNDPLGWLHSQLVEDSPFRKTAELSLSDQCLHIGSARIEMIFPSHRKPEQRQ